MKSQKEHNTLRQIKRHFPLYLMMLPGLAYLVINNYLPLQGLQLAFKKFKYNEGIWGSKFNNFKNFSFLFKSKEAFTIIRNTIGYNLAFLLLGTAFAIATAILLNGLTKKFNSQLYQTLILIPHLISWVIVGYIVYAFLGEDNGMINNSILYPLGHSGIPWYAEPKYWPFILVLINLWKTFGYNSIVYYASIIGIDRTYYEAAMVDGATTWQQIIKITLPLLKPVIITLTLLSLGRMLFSDFGLFYQVPMNSGLLYSTTNTIDTFVYRGLLETNDIGRASAAGFVQSIIGFVLVMSTNAIVRKIDKDQALF